MKLIIAIVQPEKLTDVKQALSEAKVGKMTVSNVIGCGSQGGYTESYRGAFTDVNLLDKVRFEIVVNDNFVKPTVDAIIKGARSGKIGDGKIFVVPMDECIRVRTGETGDIAVG
ncbi:nitrogen regulatory protein P-II [Smithella sp. SC_K08D17]|nr:nitrogen regulatory protein P-II [Smithella sp. D17]KIE17799.1 nitrogen regulatory protein P-II [Smithella sp. SC_K08D17]MDD5343565.1 P-II family nitrogen regulator [Smithella sp.]MDD5523589.1 P-II family nitrogen regulator [Kiritimatiellia bacterium]